MSKVREGEREGEGDIYLGKFNHCTKNHKWHHTTVQYNTVDGEIFAVNKYFVDDPLPTKIIVLSPLSFAIN